MHICAGAYVCTLVCMYICACVGAHVWVSVSALYMCTCDVCIRMLVYVHVYQSVCVFMWCAYVQVCVVCVFVYAL